MLVHNQLKQELSETINKFANAKKPLDKNTALLFGELQELILRAQTATILAKYIQSVLKKIPYRWLGFLPLVSDVRRTIETILKKPDYQLINLVVEENALIREENFYLRQEVDALKNNSQYSVLEQQILELEKFLIDKRAENGLLKNENMALCEVVTQQEADISALKESLEIAEAKYSVLAEEHEALQEKYDELEQREKSHEPLPSPSSLQQSPKKRFFSFGK